MLTAVNLMVRKQVPTNHSHKAELTEETKCVFKLGKGKPSIVRCMHYSAEIYTD